MKIIDTNLLNRLWKNGVTPIKETVEKIRELLESHIHDDRYYTELETDTKLTGKADSNHTHDDRYYTESETDTKLASKADSNHTHAYLPLVGGTLSGGIIFSADRGPGLSWFNTRQCLFTAQRNNVGTGCFMFYPQGTTSNQGALIIGDYAANDFKIWPLYDNQYDIGTSNRRFKQIYATNAAISTSDERLKDNIHTLDNTLTKAFIMGLNPISYTMVDGNSGRTHYGFGAQSIEQLMQELGMTSLDFAGFIKSPTMEAYEEIGEDGEGRIKYREIPREYIYGLRYEEFIAPLTKVVQMQEETISEQGKIIQDLSNRLEALAKVLSL